MRDSSKIQSKLYNVLMENYRDISLPCYLYATEIYSEISSYVKKNIKYDNFLLLYASMANPSKVFMKQALDEGDGLCINIGLNVGFSCSVIHHTASNLSKKELKYLSELGVALNLDSLSQVDFVLNNTGCKSFGFRVNLGSIGHSGAERLGIECDEIIAYCLKNHDLLSGKNIGLHIYIGTNFQDCDDMIPVLSDFFNFAKKLNYISYVNIGGGIGIDYSESSLHFNISKFASFVSEKMVEISSFHEREIQLILEPGRALSALSGLFVAQVTDVKLLNGKRYLGLNSSIAQFPRPFFYDEGLHQTQLIPQSSDNKFFKTKQQYRLCGCTTFSLDVMGTLETNVEPLVDDMIVFYAAGAYCESMRTDFLGISPAKSYFKKPDLEGFIETPNT